MNYLNATNKLELIPETNSLRNRTPVHKEMAFETVVSGGWLICRVNINIPCCDGFGEKQIRGDKLRWNNLLNIQRHNSHLSSLSNLRALEMYSNALRWCCFCLAIAGSGGGWETETLAGDEVRSTNDEEDPPEETDPDPPIRIPTPGEAVNGGFSTDFAAVLSLCLAGSMFTLARHINDNSIHNWKAMKRITWNTSITGCANRWTFLRCTDGWWSPVPGPLSSVCCGCGCCCCCWGFPLADCFFRPKSRPILSPLVATIRSYSDKAV